MDDLSVFKGMIDIGGGEKEVFVAVERLADVIGVVENTLYKELSLQDVQTKWTKVDDNLKIEVAMMEPGNLFHRNVRNRSLYISFKTGKTYKLGIEEVKK